MELIYQINNLKLELSKRDSDNRYLSYPSFFIKSGDFLLLKGDNGSGKTTFLEILNGVNVYQNQIVSGEVLYNVNKLKNIVSLKDDELGLLRRKNCYLEVEPLVMTGQSLYDVITYSALIANETFVYELKKMGKSKKEIKEIITQNQEEIYRLADKYFNDVLAKVVKIANLENFKNRKLKKSEKASLSSGEKKIIFFIAEVIKATIFDVKCLILDEPFPHLDEKNKKIIIDSLKELKTIKNDLVIVVSTNQDFEMFYEFNPNQIIFEKEKNSSIGKYIAGDFK